MGKLNGKPHDAGKSQSLYGRVIDALGDPFHVVNRDCALVLVSRSCRQWCQALGVQAPQEGQSLWDAFPFLPPDVPDQYRQVFQTGRAVVTEEPTAVCGREVITETKKIPLPGDDGSVECVLTVIRDVTAARQAEAALRRSDEQLRAIMSSLSETTIVIMDRDARMLSVWIPPDMAARLGRTHDELRLRKLTDIYIGPIGDTRVARIREIFQTGKPARDEYLADMPGGRFWLESSLSPVRGPDGQVAAVVSFVRDITAQKQAMAALRESEEKYRFLLENVNDVVYSTDAKGTVTYASPQAGAYGRQPEDVVGGNYLEAIVPEDRDAAVRHLQQILSTGEGTSGEFRVQVRGGGIRWIEVRGRARRDKSGAAIGIDGVARDITERRRAEEALRQSQEKYRFLLENVNDIVYSMDGQGIFAYVSPQVRRYGMEPEAMIGRSFLDFVIPEDRQAVSTDARRSISTGQEFPTHFRILDSQGQAHWFEDIGRVCRDPAGTAVGISGVLRDITERKFAEQALQEAHGMLLHAREEERRRLSRELHDSIGQALIALHLRLGSFRAEAASFLQAPLLSSLDTMNEACNALIREVRQISHGLFPATLEQLGLPPALRQLLSICPLAGIEGHLKCPKGREGERFNMDVEVALFRIAQEAVNNALRHACCRHVVVELRHDDGQLLMSVTDDGHGFDAAKPTHTGIGLASIRERAEAVGGQVQVSSGPGGTVIEARVPLPPSESPVGRKPV